MAAAITNTTQLADAIKKLEGKRDRQELVLRESFHRVASEIQPRNIIRNAFRGITESTPVKSNLFKLAVDIGSSVLSRRYQGGNSGHLLQKALGAAIAFGSAYFLKKRRYKNS